MINIILKHPIGVVLQLPVITYLTIQKFFSYLLEYGSFLNQRLPHNCIIFWKFRAYERIKETSWFACIWHFFFHRCFFLGAAIPHHFSSSLNLIFLLPCHKISKNTKTPKHKLDTYIKSCEMLNKNGIFLVNGSFDQIIKKFDEKSYVFEVFFSRVKQVINQIYNSTFQVKISIQNLILGYKRDSSKCHMTCLN